jgi:glycine betaine/proline transport system ATP-binding protein
MGLSGSGKSTLVRCIAQLTAVTKGVVTLDDEVLTSMNDEALRRVRREKLSMVFQHFGLLPHRRVIDNVAYGLEVQGISRTERQARALEVLDVVGLEGWGSHYPQQLSGGMQQRVGLARALAVDPEILFFDEPFSALDPLIRRDMQDELLRLQHEMHRTIVFITHDFAEAIKLGDRIAIMKDGGLDQIGTAAELITNPATDYVREFTKDIPKAKVLTAGDVVHPSNGDAPREKVEASVTIESLLPALLIDPRPLEVVDESGSTLGVVDRDAVARVLD